MQAKADILFEVSWEVCNKVGGIYTVVKSKAAQMENYYSKSYFLIGPYFPKNALGEFSEGIVPDSFKQPFAELRSEGIICHCGRWQIEGQPNVILLDFESFKPRANDIKKELWEAYKIDSLRAGYDYTEPLVWGYAVGKLIERASFALKGKKVVAHFHEWLSGAAILYLKKSRSRVGTVFTTHATTLGRTLSSAGVDIYGLWDRINPDDEIYRHGIESKHHLEKQSALNAGVFTTVSEITGMEAEHFLGRKPDLLVLNGLDIDKFPSFEELSIKHRVQRERLKEFLFSYFFPYYTFDMDETLFYFTASRYEFHDKGIDVFIRSLGKLNSRLKESSKDKTIVAFIWVPGHIRALKQELIESKTYFQDIKDSLDDQMAEIRSNIINCVVSGRKITHERLFGNEFLLELKNKLPRFRRKGTPPLSTHDLYDENDQVLKLLRESGLNNSESDRVKVIFYPIYLNGADGLSNLNYYEAIQASHLGVFPSYYEPWGYTPLETGAFGVASVTTDLAGFGRFINSVQKEETKEGIYVIKRLGKSSNEVVEELFNIMLKFCNQSKNDRISNKISARKIASTADWKILAGNYIEAHNLSLERLNP